MEGGGLRAARRGFNSPFNPPLFFLPLDVDMTTNQTLEMNRWEISSIVARHYVSGPMIENSRPGS